MTRQITSGNSLPTLALLLTLSACGLALSNGYATRMACLTICDFGTPLTQIYSGGREKGAKKGQVS